MMVNDLGRRRELQVISRGSARRYGGPGASPGVIGRELGVDGLLESAVVRSDDRVRITAELVDARSERLVWAEVFEGDACDFMELQDLVAEAVVEALGLSQEERLPQGVARSLHPAVQGLTCSAGGGAP
jgi:adenylate cyclase